MSKLLLLTLAIVSRCNAELILDGGDEGWSQWYRSVDGVMGGRSACRALCDADTTCGAWEYENYAADDRECELHEASVVDAEATAAQGPCQTSDPENYRCCHIDEALTESEEDATQYVPPAKPAPTDDATAGRDDHGGSKKKQSKGSEWPVVVGVVLALVFLMAIGIGCSLWARGARVDPSDSKQPAAAAPGEDSEEPLQVV